MTLIERLKAVMAVLFNRPLSVRAGYNRGRATYYPADGLVLPVIAGAAPDEGEPGGEDEPKGEAEAKEPEGKGGKEPEAKPAEPKPPWGSDEEFDPKRAWQKLQAVVAENQDLKTQRDEAQGKAQQYEDSNKTEQEKLEGRASKSETKAQEADNRAKAAENDAARLRVALRKGLDETQAKRLVGETEEELEADADDLLKSFGNEEDDESKQPPRRPREATRPGAVPKAEPEETDPRKLAEGVPSYS